MDHAFEWLETALEERDGQLVFIKRHPLCEAWAKDEPRYQDVLRRIGFPE